MNTSIIKKEKGDEIIETPVKISRKLTSTISLKKNDLVALLREENASLYEDYAALVKRYAELRKEVGKLHHIINCFSQSEMKLLRTTEELNTENGLMDVAVIKEEMNTGLTATLQNEVAKPMEFEKLKVRIRSLRKQKVQVQKSLAEKAKFLLVLYNAQKGMRPDELFNSCGIKRVTGFRYTSFCIQNGLARFSGNNRTGAYSITDMGKKFVEGEEVPEIVKKNKTSIFQ